MSRQLAVLGRVTRRTGEQATGVVGQRVAKGSARLVDTVYVLQPRSRGPWRDMVRFRVRVRVRVRFRVRVRHSRNLIIAAGKCESSAFSRALRLICRRNLLTRSSSPRVRVRVRGRVKVRVRVELVDQVELPWSEPMSRHFRDVRRLLKVSHRYDRACQVHCKLGRQPHPNPTLACFRQLR